MELKKRIYRIRDFEVCLNRKEDYINHDKANGRLNSIMLLDLEVAGRDASYKFCDDIAEDAFRFPSEFSPFKKRKL